MHSVASPMQSSSGLAAARRSGWLYRIGHPESQTAHTTNAVRVASPAVSTTLPKSRPTPHQSTPLRPQVSLAHQKKGLNTTPRLATPFKPPSFVAAAPASSPVPARPNSASRRTLGSTRPSSSLARQSLQAEWCKYADKLPTSASKTKSAASGSSLQGTDLAKWNERRAAHLEEVRNRPEPEIVPVNQKRRDGEPGDPCSWLFES